MKTAIGILAGLVIGFIVGAWSREGGLRELRARALTAEQARDTELRERLRQLGGALALGSRGPAAVGSLARRPARSDPEAGRGEGAGPQGATADAETLDEHDPLARLLPGSSAPPMAERLSLTDGQKRTLASAVDAMNAELGRALDVVVVAVRKADDEFRASLSPQQRSTLDAEDPSWWLEQMDTERFVELLHRSK